MQKALKDAGMTQGHCEVVPRRMTECPRARGVKNLWREPNTGVKPARSSQWARHPGGVLRATKGSDPAHARAVARI